MHAAAGGVGLLVCAWARRLGATVIGTVSSEAKARVAREHGCEHVIVTRDYRFADAVQRSFGGADVIVDGLGDAARDENFAALARRGHWISLGQASGAAAADRARLAGAEVDHLLAPGGVRLRRDAARRWPSARSASGTRWPTARCKAPPIERHALDAAAQAHAGSSRARTHRRAGADRLRIAPDTDEETAMIVGMNHFTVIAEDAQKTLDFYVGLLGLQRRPSARPRLRRRLALRRRHRRRCCTSTSTASRRRSAPA